MKPANHTGASDAGGAVSEQRKAAVLDATRAWATCFEDMSGPADLDRLVSLAAPDIRFKDPFNDVRGTDGLRQVFDHMYETLVAPHFSVLGVSADRFGYIHWRFLFKPKAKSEGPEWVIEGMSVIHVAEDGKISAHIDHWDAAGELYERLPIIGGVMRYLKGKLSSA